MDRIQSAIAKARARRDAGGLTDPSRPGAPGGPAAAAWAALPAARLDARQLRRNRIHADRASAEAGPFDMLRTRLLRSLKTGKWRRVAITSPDAGCGKSTLAANLALSLARQADLRIVLCEMDLRRPSLGRLLGLPEPPHWPDALSGAAPVEDRLQRIGGNLGLALCARPVDGAAELLQGAGTLAALERLERRFAPDVVLFDLPPMLRADDALAALDKVDCALLVAEAEVTPVAEIDRCEHDLAEITNVLGVVLNKLRHGGGDGYGYGPAAE